MDRASTTACTLQAGDVSVDAPAGFVFQNPDHQVVMPTVAADVAFGLGRCHFDMIHGYRYPCPGTGALSVTHTPIRHLQRRLQGI